MNTTATKPQLRQLLHDLNNALTPILANAQLAQLALGPNSGLDEELDDVMAGAKRAQSLVLEIRALTINASEDAA
ncbi:MAG: hypothetical protein AB7T31_18240 [Gemmatimonadales bacterium]